MATLPGGVLGSVTLSGFRNETLTVRPQPGEDDLNPFNGINRGVYIVDNLDFLRSINAESVDLVSIDPPFGKSDTFTADSLKPPLTAEEAQVEKDLLERWGIGTPEQAKEAGIVWPEVGYRDTWDWARDVRPEWSDDIEVVFPDVNALIEVVKGIHGRGIAAYLCFMAVRLIEIYRILKPTGSLFLHCDYSANSYLRLLLDGVFGKGNFRNEIAWNYGKVSNSRSRRFVRSHDTIYFYSRSADGTFHTLFEEGLSPRKQELVYTGYNTKNMNGKRYLYIYNQARVNQRVADGRLDMAQFDVVRTVDTSVGNVISDVFDIDHLNSQARQNTGYPTQKPVALAERIISASTNPGDIVVDCFAGSGTTALAAERLGRQWSICDNNPRTWTVLKRQWGNGNELPMFADSNAVVIGPRDFRRREIASGNA